MLGNLVLITEYLYTYTTCGASLYFMHACTTPIRPTSPVLVQTLQKSTYQQLWFRWNYFIIALYIFYMFIIVWVWSINRAHLSKKIGFYYAPILKVTISSFVNASLHGAAYCWRGFVLYCCFGDLSSNLGTVNNNRPI